MKFFCAIILASLICSCQQNGPISADSKIPVEFLKADFWQVTSAIEKQTPMPFYMCNKATYDSMKAKIYKSLDKPLSPVQFYQKLSPLVTLLNDGHFQLFIGSELVKQLEKENPTLYFPFTVFIDGNKIYSDKNMSTDTGIARGTEILMINNIPASIIVTKLRNGANLPPNLENFVERRLEDHFYRSLFTDIGLRNNFNIVFKNKIARLKGVSAEVIDQATAEPDDFSYRIIDGSNKIGYFKLNTLITGKKAKLDSVLAIFFKTLDEQKVTHLIIDIRDNRGGSTKLARAVFNYITTQKYQVDLGEEYLDKGKKVTVYDTASVVAEKVAHQFKGNTILLTNVRSYSSAHMMAISFKSAGMGKVIGQVSSEPLFISGEVIELTTLYSKCRFYHPATNFYLPGYKKEAVSYFVPDVAVYPTISDKINGRDEALEMAKQMMK